MPLGIKFSGGNFTKSYIGRRAKRWLKNAFDAIGGLENILYLIEQDKTLIEFIPQEQRYEMKAQFREHYSDYLKFLTDDNVYSWLPDDYRGVIENHPKGKEWAYKQVKLIRDFLNTS